MSNQDNNSEADQHALVADAERTSALALKARSEIQKIIFGQQQVIDLALTAVLSGGHALMVGVPGLAKTRLVDVMGTVLGLNASRIQFTPDLMPADILGSELLDIDSDGQRSFRFVKGPVFAQLLMADEINRASPRTQSALLQSMQEYQVTIAGTHYDLPRPFHVLATQNPLEQEGTYPLPEAQLDRFLLQIDFSYPDREAEKNILLETTGTKETTVNAVFDAQSLMATQQLVRRMPVGESVVNAILDLVRAARPDSASEEIAPLIAWGPGPRASQTLMLAVRARALIEGRLTPSIDDVAALAEPVLKHRMAISYAARAEGHTPTSLINQLADQHLTQRAAVA